MSNKRQRIETVDLGGGQTSTITDIFEQAEECCAYPVKIESLDTGEADSETDCIPFSKAIPQVDPSLPCQGCVFKFGKNKLGAKKNPIDLVYQVFLENQELPEADLAHLVSKAFDRYVVEPALLAGEDVDAWVPIKVLEHITSHDITPAIQIRAELRDMNHISTMVKDKINTKTGQVDASMVTLTLNLSRQKIALLSALKQCH